MGGDLDKRVKKGFKIKHKNNSKTLGLIGASPLRSQIQIQIQIQMDTIHVIQLSKSSTNTASKSKILFLWIFDSPTSAIATVGY